MFPRIVIGVGLSYFFFLLLIALEGRYSIEGAITLFYYFGYEHKWDVPDIKYLIPIAVGAAVGYSWNSIVEERNKQKAQPLIHQYQLPRSGDKSNNLLPENTSPPGQVVLKVHKHSGVKIYQTSTEFHVFSTSFSTFNDAASFVNKCLNEKNPNNL